MAHRLWIASLTPAVLAVGAPAAAAPAEMALEIAAPNAAAGAATIITGVLLLLFLYGRRAYVAYWTAGWGSLAASLALTGALRDTAAGAVLAGAERLLALTSAALFLAAAHVYQGGRIPRRYAAALLPVAGWFLLAPPFLGIGAAAGPGHLLAAVTLATAGVAHLAVLRGPRLLGAGVVGTALLVAAVVNIWQGMSPARAERISEPLLLELALYLVTALGMQLMTFEDMTLELRGANARLEKAQRELRQMVITDPLTGCRNRRFFDEIIAHELNLHRRYGTPLSLLFIDIDNFKRVNDTMGHAAGDRTLREVAQFLMRKTRDADYVFRWGGDEFLLLLSCREDEALRRGAELLLEFAASGVTAGLPPGIGLSFGCAEVSPFSESVAEAMALADERMYTRKRTVKIAGSAPERPAPDASPIQQVLRPQ